MESYEEMYNSICRICLNYGNKQNMVSLIDNNTKDGISCYGKAVLSFTNISIKKQDSLPSVMCIKCLYLLKQAIYFKLICESSDKCLRNFVSIVGDNIEKMKEKVVEYTMLRFYLPNEQFYSTNKVIKNNQKKNSDVISVTNESIDKPDNKLNDTAISADYFNDQSDIEPDKEDEDVILENMEKLINENVCTSSVKKLKPFKRKHLKIKRKLVKRQKMLAIQKAIEQRKTIKLICKVCNKVLANQHTYEHHMQRHNGCRYICEHCGKGFPVRTELQIHQVSRHGTGPYLQCSHCPFKAPRKFDLIEHERLHTGERPYTCEKCGLTFRRRGIWRKHLIYHTEKKIQCPQCPRKFFQRSEMLAHANNIHDRVYVYLCNKCGATYAKTATVRRHMSERHGIPREMQGKIIRVNKGIGYQEQ
ncbi:zinc finger protein 160-like [Vanessa cardui]|uniref:zinc finger protein 160-like n=1 Tax=Vanessa cardui TaxID=171605 RepID=UPI001F13EED3|nr:zinc finger protein 160-like [Vanessa cardui]